MAILQNVFVNHNTGNYPTAKFQMLLFCYSAYTSNYTNLRMIVEFISDIVLTIHGHLDIGSSCSGPIYKMTLDDL